MNAEQKTQLEAAAKEAAAQIAGNQLYPYTLDNIAVAALAHALTTFASAQLAPVEAERDALKKEQETRRRMDDATRDHLDPDASRDWLREFAAGGDAKPRR